MWVSANIAHCVRLIYESNSCLICSLKITRRRRRSVVVSNVMTIMKMMMHVSKVLFVCPLSGYINWFSCQIEVICLLVVISGQSLYGVYVASIRVSCHLIYLPNGVCFLLRNGRLLKKLLLLIGRPLGGRRTNRARPAASLLARCWTISSLSWLTTHQYLSLSFLFFFLLLTLNRHDASMRQPMVKCCVSLPVWRQYVSSYYCYCGNNCGNNCGDNCGNNCRNNC